METISTKKSTMKTTVLLFPILFAVCISDVHGISGGSSASITAFPHAVSVQLRGSHHCGGSIISVIHILTAAHCTDNDVREHDLTILSSTDNLQTSKPIIHKVAMIIRHPSYRSNGFEHDIAVLKLKSQLAFSMRCQQIFLPSDEIIDPLIELKVSGWGKLHQNDVEASQYLRQIQAYPLPGGNSNPMLLASMLNGTVTMGDSGSGLISKGEKKKIIGVVSITRHILPNVGTFSRVFLYNQWILEVMGY